MCIKGGYILQPRIIDESSVSKYPPHVREIWGYLLRRANHKDAISFGVLIKRGQLKTSYSDILNDLSWFVGYRKEGYKKHHCETAMKLLMKERMVTTTKTTRGIIVTICNYDYYQDPKNYETDNHSDNETTMKPQSTDTINKNVKNIKKILLSEINSDDFPDLNSEYIEITKAFRNLFKENLIEAGASTKLVDKAKGTWIDSIRLMIEVDKYSLDDLRKVYSFLKKDAFWKQNILSTSKLREQIDKILMKMKNSKEGKDENKLYSYEEASALVTAGKAKSFDDFELKEVEGVVYRVFKKAN